MPSSEPPTSRIFRRMLWFATAILVAVCAYIGGWYYLANRLQEEVDKTLVSLNREGREARCEGSEVRGFPFRIGLFCNSVAYSNANNGVAVRAAAFRSAAQVYDPATIVGELDGPMQVELPGLVPLTLGWELMHASLRLAQPIPTAISVEGRAVTAALQDGAEPLFTAGNGQMHMRVNQADMDLAGSFVDMRLTGLPADTPPMRAEANLTVLDGVALAREPAAIATTGYRTQIRSMSLSFGSDAAIGVSGPLSVDASGLIDAELTLTAREPDEIARFMAVIFPDQAREIEMAAQGLALLGNAPSVPLRISKGRASIAFITLGDIPALLP